jgi:hypothetical protein
MVSFNIFCQDIIVLKNGTEIQSKVLEITTGEIKYKKFDNLEGPVISILKSDVSVIKYQNGTKEVLSSTSSSSNTSTTTSTNTSTNSSSNIETQKKKKYVDDKPNRFGIYVNPLGFVQFGPMAGMELTLGSHLIIDAHVRFSSVGLLMYVVANDDKEGWPDQITGLGVGGGIKLLIPSRIGGFYMGVLLEDGWQKQYYAKDKSWTWVNESGYIVVAPNIGYKFRFQSGFYMNTGAIFGAAFVGKDQWHYTKNYNNDKSTHIKDSHIQPFGMLELAFGVEF